GPLHRRVRRNRYDGGAEPDAAEMETDAAGEQAIAVRVVHDTALPRAGTIERTRTHLAPEIEVSARVADERRPATGAARAVDRHDLVLRHREHAERVGVPEVLLARR